MRSIHYFPRYSQRENTVTNNVLLLLLRLMDESRTKFEQFITSLAGDADLMFSPQWLRIGQQQKTAGSVVDGYIAQDSFKIVVETKMAPQFLISQLEQHLTAFVREDHRLLILLAPEMPPETPQLKNFRARAQEKRVSTLATTFERIIEVMRTVLSPTDDVMNALVDDFESFCDESDRRLLPNDRFMLFTPPCGPSHPDNELLRLYYCPSDRPARRAQYLGIYANKTVRSIGRIAKVVSCEINLETASVMQVDNSLLTEEEKKRVLKAAQLAPSHDWDITTGHKFYLCDEWEPTDYRKVSPGGIPGARMLDLRSALGDVPNELSALANGLRDKTWV